MNKIKATVFLLFCLSFLTLKMNAQGPCPIPTSIQAINGTPTSAEFVWNTAGIETQWEIIIQMAGAAAPSNNVSGETVSEMSYYADFLIPETGYDVYVRAICSSTQQSNWSGPFYYYYYPPVSNDSCDNATTLTVNTNNQCTQSMPALFQGASTSSEPGYCGENNDADIWFKFIATHTVHAVQLSNFSGSALPIVLTMYEGADCTISNQVYCSTVNYITATALTVGQTYLIRASINGVNTAKDTKFDICVSTPSSSGNNNSLQCLIDTINSDFENPGFSNNSVNFINHHAMQGWRTTASDEIIEVWNNFQNVTAYSGSQFIELNANQASGVYQDFNTPVSTVFTFGFAHRGRQGTDVCGLYAGPPGGPYELIKTSTTGTSAWNYYTGTYTVPEGQTETRFKFEAISAAGGITVGNFLDDISFRANNGIISENPIVLDCSLNISSLIVAAGVGTWTIHPDNPAPTSINNVNLNSPSITGFSAPGIYQYTWTTLYCSDTLLVEFFGGTVDAPVAPNVQYCQNATALPLTATALPNHTLKWHTSPSGGTASAQAPIPDTASTGSLTYYVSQSSGFDICESPRTAITVNITEPAPVSIELEYEENQYCISTATIHPITALVQGAVFTTDNGLTIDSTTGAINFENATAGHYTITYTIEADPINCIRQGVATFNLTLTESTIPVTDFYYPENLCHDNENMLPILADGFITGGIFEAPEDLSINPITGAINVSESTQGSYNITYSIAGSPNDCRLSGTGNTLVVLKEKTNFTLKGECRTGRYILFAEGNSDANLSHKWKDENGVTISTDELLDVTVYLQQNPSLVIPVEGLPFWLTITENGCEQTILYNVNSAFCSIPKGISPNGDDKNDAFDLTGMGVQKLIIYNRYGTSVYEHKGNYSNQWHGQSDKGDQLPDGTYFYYLETNDNQKNTGWVYINR